MATVGKSSAHAASNDSAQPTVVSPIVSAPIVSPIMPDQSMLSCLSVNVWSVVRHQIEIAFCIEQHTPDIIALKSLGWIKV